MAEWEAIPDGLGQGGVFNMQNTSKQIALLQPASSSIVTVTVVTGPTFTYLFRGFYAAGNQYENWSGPSRNTPPPTGHTLLDTTVIGII